MLSVLFKIKHKINHKWYLPNEQWEYHTFQNVDVRILLCIGLIVNNGSVWNSEHVICTLQGQYSRRITAELHYHQGTDCLYQLSNWQNKNIKK